MPYQIAFLNESLGDATAAAIRASLTQAVQDLGLDPAVDLTLLNETSWSTWDPRYPTVAIYFGGGAAAPSTINVLNDVISAGLTTFPVVATLKNYQSAVPAALAPINGVAIDAADPECRCLVDDLLRELRLIRSKRLAFISYKRSDSSAVAEQLYRALDDRKYDVFLDTHSVEPGHPFQSILWDRLGDADVLILLNTPNAFTSHWVEQEVTRAQNLGLGVIEVVWPGEKLRSDLDLCTRVMLEGTSLDADCRLVTGTLYDVLNCVEAIRAQSFAARRARVVADLQSHAAAAGIPAHLQPDGTIDVLHNGRMLRVQPIVGHPESQLIHETHESCSAKSPDLVGAVIFDDLGLFPSKNSHLRWLNSYLPVRAVGVSELPSWLV